MSSNNVKNINSSNVILGNSNGDVKNIVNSPASEELARDTHDALVSEPWYKRPFGIISMSIISITVASLLVKWLLS